MALSQGVKKISDAMGQEDVVDTTKVVRFAQCSQVASDHQQNSRTLLKINHSKLLQVKRCRL